MKTHIIRSRSHPRAGLVGNPSDGYHGKTIAFTFDHFFAETVMHEAPCIELLPSHRDRTLYDDFDALEQTVRECGYYGGIRLLQAALRCFHHHCRKQGIEINGRGFAMRYYSNIPHHVGMAGSSAIITACFRSLMIFYGVEIPPPELANLVWSVEKEELGIEAGLQDRVAQACGGLTCMDFSREVMTTHGHGIYEPLDPASLPPLFIAYKQNLGESSDRFHNHLRARYDKGEPAVLRAMEAWADLATQMRNALAQGGYERVARLVNANFDLRRRLCNIHPENIEMVETARGAGASAKFTGSGGAIVGTYTDDAMYARLEAALHGIGATVFKPRIA